MYRRTILGVCLSVLTAGMMQVPALAANIDILRSVPLEISGYSEAQALPSKFTTADQVLQVLNSNKNLLIRMETIRRSYFDLDTGEQEKLLTTLLKRYQTSENDAQKFFDHGYAQLVYKENKTGLFFLRKANDRIGDQFSSLAYAMGQAQIDLNVEGAPGEEMTTRKLDVIFKMKDSVQRDAEAHKPGFWPSFVRVVDKLKPLTAYDSFVNTDFSLKYVPYGNSVTPRRGVTTTSLPLQASTESLLSNSEATSCNPNAADEAGSDGTMAGNSLSSRAVDFNGTGETAMIQFFRSEEPNLYRVRVSNGQGFPMLSFTSPVMPSIVEDLEGDGTFELVVRQHRFDPFHPVVVYRLTPCGFELDKKIFDYFST